MKERSNHQYYLNDSIFLGSELIQGYALYDLGSYPGIISEKNECIKGEVYEVDDKTIARLDRLKGEGFLYTRGRVKVEMDNGSLEDAYVYMWNGSIDIVRKVYFINQPWNQNNGINKK